MTMLNCRGCGHSIHCTAPACPKSGALQDSALTGEIAANRQEQASGGASKGLKVFGWIMLSVVGLGILSSIAMNRAYQEYENKSPAEKAEIAARNAERKARDAEEARVKAARQDEEASVQARAEAAEVARVLSEDPFILGAEVFVRELQTSNSPMCQQLGQFAAQRLQMVRSMHKQHAERAMVEMYEIAEKRGCV